MKRSYLFAITLSLAALSVGPAMASDVSTLVTRDQVKAELAEAIRTGDIMAAGLTGLKMNELYPDRYPAKATPAQVKTREQVKAELGEAIRTGDIVADDLSGLKMNELYPDRYPAKAAATVQAKTREQVKAELVEAIRTGDIVADDLSGLKMNQLYPGRYPAKAATAQAKAGKPVKAGVTETNRTGIY